jgi:hypothetical protein
LVDYFSPDGLDKEENYRTAYCCECGGVYQKDEMEATPFKYKVFSGIRTEYEYLCKHCKERKDEVFSLLNPEE